MAFSSRFIRPAASIARFGAAPSAGLTASRLFHSSAARMAVQDITKTADFKALVAKTDKAVLVDCFAEWCGPCKAISPILQKLSEEPELSTIEFVKFDVDQLPDLAQELKIRAMPTFLIFKDGERVDELVGANPPALLQLLQKYAQ